jgi:hypothetical protein
MTTLFSMIDALNVDPQGVQGILFVFLALAIGHAVADFPLQGPFLAEAKNRHGDVSSYFVNETPSGVWFHAMTAHSLIHAGAVWWITGSAVLGSIELVLHWIIDYAKCEGWTSFSTDQILHYVCKVTYAMLIYLGVAWI